MIGISIRLRGIRKISFVGFLINVNIKSNIEFVAFVMIKALKDHVISFSRLFFAFEPAVFNMKRLVFIFMEHASEK